MTVELHKRFKNLFIGYENACGQHKLHAEAQASGKIKGDARTVSTGATDEMYAAHLRGAGTSLGLIPLMEDNHCWFGAIDVDIQGEVKLHEPIADLEARIRAFELPLVVCRSKSGGAHLYLFASKPISAKVMQAKLTEFSAILGYGGCEVFPKQSSRVDEKDRGNWINIAMYGAESEAGTNRYALRNGTIIDDLKDFLTYAESMRINQRQLEDVVVKLGDLFEDGPPCLQHLATFGIGEGGRNTTMTNVCIYFKLKNEETWQDEGRKFNAEHVHPSLEHQELDQIFKNVTRKKYFYTCKQPPICNHCEKKICLKREFGIGSGKDEEDAFLQLDNLTKCVSKDSVRWYAEHEGCRVELSTEQLLSPVELQKVFVEKFSKLIIPGKKIEWHKHLAEMMDTCTQVQDPDDASVQGQFENLLDNFFSSSRPGRNRDELIKGNNFTENGRVYFRSEDLFNYLNVRRFNQKPHEVWSWLKQLGAQASQMRIKGKMIRVWSLPEPERFDGSDIAMPTQLVGEL